MPVRPWSNHLHAKWQSGDSTGTERWVSLQEQTGDRTGMDHTTTGKK